MKMVSIFKEERDEKRMLDIPLMYQERLRAVYEYFNQQQFEDYEIYLFGSYVTKKMKETSDIDLLILIDEVVEPRRMKALRMEIREAYEEQIKYAYEVDIKVYGKERFYELTQKLCFESEIAKYMIPLEEAVCGE